MKLAVLFSGGKDSCLALCLAKKMGYEVSCLINIISENPESFMFHTPNVERVKKQAEVLGIPLIQQKTEGKKELELKDLEAVILKVKEKFRIEGIVSGAVESVYQSTRIQKICNRLQLECFNPLWQRDQFELLEDLIKNKFEIIITGVFAYPFDRNWLGREINRNFIEEIKELNKRYKISPSGEGGEMESFVLNCPLFKRRLEIVSKNIKGKGNSWVMEVDVK